ncbi:MAG: twin-arginine translocation signal domain-containing protein, partial [Slackia sp.]|nr:twin-arginine translocation signal domain-containing protein [Slackia sp.]
MKEIEGISRRGFLGAMAGIGAVGAIGLAGCAAKAAPATNEEASSDAMNASDDWLGTAPEIAESDISETKET